MLKLINYFCILFFLTLSLSIAKEKASPAVSEAISVPRGPLLNAKQALLIDLTTGEILFEKNAHEKMPPSSMSKILTTYLAFEELKSGRLKMTDTIMISEKAWRKGGSKMFLQLNTLVSVEDLLRGIIIQSGNDACIALAEKISGSEEVFAAQMTKTAKEFGAVHSNFVNSTGWPDENQYSTAWDLALIAQKLIEKFPEYYPLHAEKEFTYNKIHQMNRNTLLGSFPGADGLKTGATDAGGYGLVGSAIQEGRRLILVINGTESKKKRSQDAKTLMQWGFSNFVSPLLFKVNDVIEKADVWLGDKAFVNLILSENVYVTLPRQEIKNIKISLSYKKPLAAPLKAGQPVGHMIVSVPHKPDRIISILAAETVNKAGFFAKIKSSFFYILQGHH